MIHGIYIIDNRGICILSREYGSIKIDENLIGGFLTAILRFSSKLIEGEEDENNLQEILLRNYRILYESTNGIRAVSVIDREDNEVLVREILSRILSVFVERFEAQLQNWNGNVQPFMGFEAKIDELLVESEIGELIPAELEAAAAKVTGKIDEHKKPALSLKQILRRSKTFMFKTILAGDSMVGKTSIVKKATENNFPEEYSPTIGCDFAVKQLDMGKNKVRLHFWDFSGSADFGQVRKELYIDADMAVLVFDLTNPESFKNLEKWRKEIINSFGPLHLIIIGNKSDAERKIPIEECVKYAEKINAPYFETSAKLGTNIEEAFKKAANLLLESM
ncbi:MAG: GTP-binding protein [Candidatus Freyarchaeota archaeon]